MAADPWAIQQAGQATYHSQHSSRDWGRGYRFSVETLPVVRHTMLKSSCPARCSLDYLVALEMGLAG